MNGLDETQLVEFLEAVYSLDRSDDEWLTAALRALSAACGSSYMYVGFLYDASNVADLRLWNFCRLQSPPPELASTWRIFESIASPAFVRSTFRSLLYGSLRKSTSPYTEALLAERERLGYGDLVFLNGLDPSGIGCMLLIGGRQRDLSPQGKQAALVKRMSSHLSAAYRCRRKLSTAPADVGAALAGGAMAGAEAILDAAGRVVHAQGEARSASALEQIKAAAAQIDAARTRSGRSHGSDALASWHPLTSARWTLVDAFEQGGKRYVVARENQAEVTGFDALTDRERQIVVHAALGLSNKEIAYTLGISDATVRVLMARAAKRFGVRKRKELLAHSTLRELRPSSHAEP
jgi:DNA-binding NarL/FixJ family response regulator